MFFTLKYYVRGVTTNQHVLTFTCTCDTQNNIILHVRKRFKSEHFSATAIIGGTKHCLKQK